MTEWTEHCLRIYKYIYNINIYVYIIQRREFSLLNVVWFRKSLQFATWLYEWKQSTSNFFFLKQTHVFKLYIAFLMRSLGKHWITPRKKVHIKKWPVFILILQQLSWWCLRVCFYIPNCRTEKGNVTDVHTHIQLRKFQWEYYFKN